MAVLLSVNSLEAGPLVPSNARGSRPNAFGGRTYYTPYGYSRSERNSFGGYNYYNNDGRMNMRSYPYSGGYERYQRYSR